MFGEGQRWGFGRHLGAAVCAMVLAEDFDQVIDLAPCHLPRKEAGYDEMNGGRLWIHI